MKTCSKCKIEKNEADFSKSRKSLSVWCKACFREHRKQLTKTPKWKEHRKNYELDFAKKNPRKVKNKNLKRLYGITIEEYEQMLISQNNVCKICCSSDHRKLCVDHCHKTGKIRGLLCNKCNQAIGLLKDSIELLQRTIDYLN